MLPLLQPLERGPLWRREVRQRWRRPWTFVLLGLYCAFLAFLAHVFYAGLVPKGEYVFSKFGLGLGAKLFWKFVTWQIVGWIPLGLLLGAPAIAAEREKRFFTDYMLAGINSAEVTRAKWDSLASFALVLVVAPLPVAALCFPLGGVSPLDFITANIMCVGLALASCATGLALSATHRTVSAALASAMGKIASVTLMVIPLSIVLPPSAASPPVLITAGAICAYVPRYLLPRIEEELFLLSVHLEEDEPQTPDQHTTRDEVPARLEPLKAVLLADSSLAREGVGPQEIAHYLNETEARRGSLDPPPSSLDLALESFVARNALARRDVQTQLRSWRRQLTIRPPASLYCLSASLWVGGALALFGLLVPESGVATGIHFLWRLGLLLILLQIALLSASGFARERAGNMMVQLQLSALSPTEILGAKIVSPLVLGARFWGLPLLALTVASLSYDWWRVLLEAILFISCVLLTALVGTWCSLRFRTIPLAMTAVLFVQSVALFVLPALSSLLFASLSWLRTWWLDPINSLLWGLGDTSMMAHLFVPLASLMTMAWWGCLRAWNKAVQNS